MLDHPAYILLSNWLTGRTIRSYYCLILSIKAQQNRVWVESVQLFSRGEVGQQDGGGSGERKSTPTDASRTFSCTCQLGLIRKSPVLLRI